MVDGTAVEGSYNNYGVGFSLEAGRKFYFLCDQTGFIEPQIQASYYYIKGSGYTLSNGMNVDNKDLQSLVGRAGLVLGKKWLLEDGGYIQPYLKGGALYEFLADQKVTINGEEFNGDLTGIRGYYGVGLDWKFYRSARLYAEFEGEHGDHISTPWGVSIGFRLNF